MCWHLAHWVGPVGQSHSLLLETEWQTHGSGDDGGGGGGGGGSRSWRLTSRWWFEAVHMELSAKGDIPQCDRSMFTSMGLFATEFIEWNEKCTKERIIPSMLPDKNLKKLSFERNMSKLNLKIKF